MCSNLWLNVGHGPDPLQELDDPGLLLRHVAGSDAIDLAGGLEQFKEKFFFLNFGRATCAPLKMGSADGIHKTFNDDPEGGCLNSTK